MQKICVLPFFDTRIEKGKPINILGKVLLCLIVITCGSTSFAWSSLTNINSETKGSPSKHMNFNLSVFYPLSLNKDDDISTDINLSLFYGKVGSVSGFELSGFVNYVKRDVLGFEAAGLVNYVGGNMTGLETAGWVNYVCHNLEGIQMAGIYNYVGGNALFLQAAAIVNSVEGNFGGFQAAGAANILKGNLTGLQVSVFNLAGNVTGAQVSVVNIAKEVNGVQIGVINIAKKINGVSAGLINYVEEGKIHPVFWSTNIIQSNAGVKSAVNDYFYSIFSVGYNNLSKDVSKSIAWGYTIGLHFPVQDRLFIDTDIGYYSIDNDKLFKEDEGVKNQIMLQGRLIVGVKLLEKFSIFAGVGRNYAFDHGQRIDKGKYETMFLAGLQLF